MTDIVDTTDTADGAATLLVDLGNRRIKWAWLAGGLIRGHGSSVWPDLSEPGSAGASARPAHAEATPGLAATSRRSASAADAFGRDDMPKAAHGALPFLFPSPCRPARVLYAPMTRASGNQTLENAVRQQWGLSAEACPAEAFRNGLMNGYASPARLGADRWAAMLAAWQQVQGAVCVMDAGTALTIDCIDAAGRHQAGYLFPGAALIAGALSASTGVQAVGVPHATEPHEPGWHDASGTDVAGDVAISGVPGHGALDTATCLEAALALALTGLVQGAWRRFHAAHPQARLFVTGGDAGLLASALDGWPVEKHPHLVLEGLAARTVAA